VYRTRPSCTKKLLMPNRVRGPIFFASRMRFSKMETLTEYAPDVKNTRGKNSSPTASTKCLYRLTLSAGTIFLCVLFVPTCLCGHAVDVSGTDPCAPSLVAAAARRTLSAASAREQTKIMQYGPMVRAFGDQISPIVFETHGGLGDKAIEFVDKLSLHAATRPGPSSRGNFGFHPCR
jgi:hypothetical protein